MTVVVGAVALGVVSGGTASPLIGYAVSEAVGTIAGGVVASGGSTAAAAGAAAIGVGVEVSAGAAAASTTGGMAIALSGPVGWVLLGATENTDKNSEKTHHVYSFDCWKQILHVDSAEPSNGIFLLDIMKDRRVKNVEVNKNETSNAQLIIIENIWQEKFRIDFLMLQDGKLAAHAERI